MSTSRAFALDEKAGQREKLQSPQHEANETNSPSKRADGRGHRKESGDRAAARVLDLDKEDVRRARKVASLSDEAKDVARATGLDNNRTALLAAAEHEDRLTRLPFSAIKCGRLGKRKLL